MKVFDPSGKIKQMPGSFLNDCLCERVFDVFVVLWDDFLHLFLRKGLFLFYNKGFAVNHGRPAVV